MKRRKKRRYRKMKKNSGMKLLGFIGIIIGAIICGYVTARFFVAPLLGYDTEVLHLDISSRLTSYIDQKRQDAEAVLPSKEEASEAEAEAETEKKYVLQFGVFSNKDGADQLVSKLKAKDIEAELYGTGGTYKVICDGYATKDEALKQAKQWKKEYDIDVFVTEIKE